MIKHLLQAEQHCCRMPSLVCAISTHSASTCCRGINNKVEEDLGNPVKMLEEFRKAEQEMEALQNNILNELKKAME